jgi:hypothetical protein
MARYRIAPVGVVDTVNGDALILPNRAGWREYEIWMTQGNTPDPLPVVPHVVTPAEQAALDELAARDAIRAELRLDAAVQALRTRTPAQVDAWLDANVTDLSSARAVLKILARILALLARERIGT